MNKFDKEFIDVYLFIEKAKELIFQGKIKSKTDLYRLIYNSGLERFDQHIILKLTSNPMLKFDVVSQQFKVSVGKK